MFRSTSRLASNVRTMLTGESSANFLGQVERRLQDVRSGQLTAPADHMSYWEAISRESKAVAEKNAELDQLRAMLKEGSSDSELRAIAEGEMSNAKEELDARLDELAAKIVPSTELDMLAKCQIELTSGAGGQEAMLFTSEIMQMYEAFVLSHGWKWEPIQVDNVALGGIRSAVIAVSGEKTYSKLRFEAGIHRVQRVPINDSRMHTSTAGVSVLPEPEEVSVIVPSDSVKIETMRASGPGGQNVNKRSTAVRMTHKETGIAVHCMDERFQHLNIQIAYKRLAAILMQQKVDSLSERISSDRKLQVGSKARAEKIRTYNFQHDRVTDHRIQLSLSGVKEFLRGGELFETMVHQLDAQYAEDRLRYVLDNCQVDHF